MQYTQQNVMQLLEDFNLGQGTLGGIPNIDPWSIKQSMTDMFNFSPDILSSNLFSGITPSSMYGMFGKNYSPSIQPNILSFAKDMGTKLGGTKYTGGFAGSGYASDYETSVRDEFGRSAGDVLKTAQTSRNAAMENLMNTIQGWQQTASTFV